MVANKELSNYLLPFCCVWKDSSFPFLPCHAEFIRGMDEDAGMSWMLGDMLSPQDPSLDAVVLAGERTRIAHPFMRPIYHLSIWLAVTFVLHAKVSPTLALSRLSPVPLYPNVCGVDRVHPRNDLLSRLCVICRRIVSNDPIWYKRPSEIWWSNPVGFIPPPSHTHTQSLLPLTEKAKRAMYWI